MAKETYGHEGNQIVSEHIIKEQPVTVYGCFSKDTKIGRYDFYDVYVEISGGQHCMNEGEPFYRKPNKAELKDLTESYLSDI
jgi:hypothetical protein